MGGSNSKASFSGIVNRLLKEEVPPSDHDFWDALWKTTISVNDVFDVIEPMVVRKLIDDRFNNVKTVFAQAVTQLYQVVETPYPVYFDQALNCLRILARIIPIMLANKTNRIMDLFWAKQIIPVLLQAPNTSSKILYPSSPSSPAPVSNSTTTATSSVQETTEMEPLAVILVNAMFHLLFLPDFTIEDPNVDFAEGDITTHEFKSALMWAPGVGSPEKSIVSSTQFDNNRVDVLRLMLCAFSDPLYQRSEMFDSCGSYWLEVATSADIPYAEIAFYSLLNTVLGYDPIGWGLPYGNYVATDTAKTLMESSVHTLIALLDYGLPIRPSGASAAAMGGHPGDSPSSSPEALPTVAANDSDSRGFNVFRRLLSSIEDPGSLNFMFRGFVRLLNNVHQCESAYLPFSVTRITIEQELLVLLWKCLEEVPAFMPFILKSCDVSELLVPICFFLSDGRRDNERVGLMYLCTFILLKLSGERSFGVQLNKAYQLNIPVDIPLFTGTHADLLIITLHKMIVAGSAKLATLYNCFLTIICNVSPYCKTLCSVSAVKLVSLFQLFTSPTFLYASEDNHAYVTLLLETFNNLIQYQYEGNANLVYALIRRKDVVDALLNLTLPGAIEQASASSSQRSRSSSSAPQKSVTTNATSAGDAGAASVKATADVGAVTAPGGSSAADAVAKETSKARSSTRSKGKATTGREGADNDPAVMSASASTAPTGLVSTASVELRIGGIRGVVESEDAVASSTKNASSSPMEVTVSAASNADKIGKAAVAPAQQQMRPSASAGHVSVSGFEPSQRWLDTVKAELPLATISRLLRHLVPQIQQLAATKDKDATSSSAAALDEAQVLDFIRSTTMVGLLPVPHPIVIRKYQPNKHTRLWFTAFQWGVIFMQSQGSFSLFDAAAVKLFSVKST